MRQKLIRNSAGAIGIALVLAATTVWAQQPPARVRGTIEKVEGPIYVLKLRDGAMLNMKLADDARVSALVKASLADLKEDSFIGVAGMPEADGSVKAFSIHIFLPAQRGVVPDRTGPWDARPGSTMTNAYVEHTVTSKDGAILTVKYKDGEKKVVVTPETVIAAAAPGDKSELKAGAQIIIFGSEKQPDGSLLVKSMYVGRNVAPAM
jgi:hypothetical protein